MKYPIGIRIQLDAAGEQFHQYIAVHQEQVEEEINAAVKQAVRDFDFHAVVVSQVHIEINKQVTDAVKRYFSYGDGEKFINSMVTNVLNEATNS